MAKKDKLEATDPRLISRRKIVEASASIGMILIIVAMFLPLLNMLSIDNLHIFKWIFAGGTLMYWGARCVDISSKGESIRIRRLRRIEFWAGACFGVAAFFWFFNENKFGQTPGVGPLTILKDTILFALAGAVLQIVAAWMIYFRVKKESKRESNKNA
ncbi:MAG: hypothetical protein NC217_06430 [Muribaculaceae bacterium]|nr:hypothetical protein [Muribaculaceae bacterium]